MRGLQLASKQIKTNNQIFDIAYEIINPSCEKTIVFLHGWGSNKELMKQGFQNQFKKYKHLYVDMPGFGKSSNNYVLTTKEYANIMRSFLELLHLDIKMIFGHSFGGKVATLLKPELLVLLSSAGILETKSTKTMLTIRMSKIFNKFGLRKVTKILRSEDVNMMSEVMYETFKNVVDEDFSKEFQHYKGKTLIFWGENDTATHVTSGKEIHTLIENSFFKSFHGDHYFFLQKFKEIENIIKEKIK